MDNYVIVSDVTCDLTSEVVESLDISVIPMRFQLGTDNYTHYSDERELSCEEFYRRLKAGEDAATSQINPVIYESFFEPFLKSGKDIIYIALTSGLSGTYNTARLAASDLLERYPNRKIAVIDSACASIGEGMLVYHAAMQQKQGSSMEETVEFIEKTKEKIAHWFLVEDLLHLKRGGRLNSLEAVVGTALKICPILSLNSEGKLYVAAKIRSKKKALEYLCEKVKTEGNNISEQTVLIGHGNCRETAEIFGNMLVENGLVKNYIITSIGPVIGSHTGQGMCSVSFIQKTERQ